MGEATATATRNLEHSVPPERSAGEPVAAANPSKLKLSVIVPDYNEREFLPQILEKLTRALTGVEKEIVIVDDRSTDGTREWIAENLGEEPCYVRGFEVDDTGDLRPLLMDSESARMLDAVARSHGQPGFASQLLVGAGAPVAMRALYHEHNLGKGAAIRTGLEAVTGDVIVIQDGDLEYDPEDLGEFWRLIESGRADVVYGSRFQGRPHRCLYYHHYLANRVISWLFSILYNQILSDLEVCYKMFTREVKDVLTLRANDFGFEIEFSANVAKRRNLRIFEVGISYYGRTYAEGKKINWRDGLKALWYLLRFRFV